MNALHAHSCGTGKLQILPVKVLVALLFLATVVLSPSRLFSQAAPSAYDRHINLWAGAEFSNFQPDYSPSHRLDGIGAFVDWSVTPRIAVEGEMRFLHFNGVSGETQDHYLIGPKMTTLHWVKFRPYAKFLIGVGRNNFPYNIGYGKYFAMAPGGGVDYQLTPRFAVRGDYEYQLWPGAPAIPGQTNNGMTPNGFSVGFAYRFLHR